MQETIGPYKILHTLGAGGMGAVCLARHLGTGEECALKILPPHLLHSPSRLTRFKREIDIALRFDHPNIISVFDAGRDGDSQFLAMEYLPLGSLEQELRDRLLKRQPFSIEQAVEITCQIALALAYAHKQGVIHRDVTPGNILCARRDRATTNARGNTGESNDATQPGGVPDLAHYKLGDFGLALEDNTTRLSLAGGIGTVDYISPEAVLPDARVDARSDVYSLGVVLYEMLTLRPLFIAEHPLAKLNKLIHEAHVPVAQLRADIPEALNKIVERALAKHPAKRFQSAGEFAEALHRFQAKPARRTWKLPTWRIKTPRLRATQSQLHRRLVIPLVIGLMCSGLVFLARQHPSSVALSLRWVQRLSAVPVNAISFAPSHQSMILQKPTTLLPTVSARVIQPLPSPTLAHAPSALIGVNGSDSVVLARQQPTLTSSIVGEVQPSGRPEILGKSTDGHWWLISLVGDATGWIPVTSVRTMGNESAVPIVPVVVRP